jgi:hypothetical protein
MLDDFGQLGRSYLETDEEAADLKTVRGMIEGQYRNPVRLVALNTAEGGRVMSEDVALEVARRAAAVGAELPYQILTFLDARLAKPRPS